MLRVRGISGRASIDIAAPPDQVWEYLVDAEKVAILGPFYSRLMRQGLTKLKELAERDAPAPAS